MFKPKKGLIAILALLYIIATSFFIWGLAVGKSEIFPWKQLAPLYDEIHAYFTFQEAPKKSPKEKVMLHHQESRSKYNFGGLRVRDKEFHDEGYLLISGFNKKQNQVIVELFSIAELRKHCT